MAGDLTSLFCISVNRSGRVRNLTAGVLVSDREGLLDVLLLLDTGESLTLPAELSEVSKFSASEGKRPDFNQTATNSAKCTACGLRTML